MTAGYPRRGSALGQRLAQGLLRLAGWRVEGLPPELPRFVLIVAPHTSNWDFPVCVLAMFAVRLHISWLGKHSLFRFPVTGLLRWLGGEPVQRGVAQGLVEQAIDRMKSLGAETVEVSLPHTDYGVATYYIIATAEASSNLARFDGIRYGHRTAQPADLLDLYRRSREEGFGPEVKRRIILGTYVLSSGYYDAYYLRAQKVRTLIRNDFDKAFAHCDVIAGPVTPTPAFRIGDNAADPLALYLADLFTLPANLAGLPGISVPCGLATEGNSKLPVGLQFLAKPLGEPDLFRAAHGWEQSGPWQESVLG